MPAIRVPYPSPYRPTGLADCPTAIEALVARNGDDADADCVALAVASALGQFRLQQLSSMCARPASHIASRTSSADPAMHVSIALTNDSRQHKPVGLGERGMMKTIRYAALCWSAVLSTTAASAAITDIRLQGPGLLADHQGFYHLRRHRGSFVVDIHLGTETGDPERRFQPVPPDNFTGTYVASHDELYRGQYTTILVSDDNGRRLWSGSYIAYGGATFDFVDGVLTSFSAYFDEDPDVGRISYSGGYGYFGYYANDGLINDYYNGEFNTLGVPYVSSVPDVESWLLLTLGFLGAGSVARRRRALLA